MSQILTLTDISYCYPGAPEPLFEHLSATFAAGWAAVLGDNVCLARRVAGVRFGLFECRLSGCSRCR